MRLLVLASLLAVPASSFGAELTAAERGKKALTETSFIPPAWRQSGYDNVWKNWEGATEKPADYEKAIRDRYGLHPAPYPNHGLPMGLRPASFLLIKGVSVDCMLCHGGSIMGKSYVGLGNSSLEFRRYLKKWRAPTADPPGHHLSSGMSAARRKPAAWPSTCSAIETPSCPWFDRTRNSACTTTCAKTCPPGGF